METKLPKLKLPHTFYDGYEARKYLKVGQTWKIGHLYARTKDIVVKEIKDLPGDVFRVEFEPKASWGFNSREIQGSSFCYELVKDVPAAKKTKQAIVAPVVVAEKSVIDKACDYLDSLKQLMREKNKSYGNSIEEPIHPFVEIDNVAGILVRAQDKLSRIVKGNDYGEDNLKDFLVYIALAQGSGWDGKGLTYKKEIK